MFSCLEIVVECWKDTFKVIYYNIITIQQNLLIAMAIEVRFTVPSFSSNIGTKLNFKPNRLRDFSRSTLTTCRISSSLINGQDSLVRDSDEQFTQKNFSINEAMAASVKHA